jgi:hypothetical protein
MPVLLMMLPKCCILFRNIKRWTKYISLSIYLSVCLWLYIPLDLGRFFSFLMYTQSVGLLGMGISLSQSHCLHTEQHRQNKCTDIHVSSGIRNHDPSVLAGEDGSFLRPRGHCNRLEDVHTAKNNGQKILYEFKSSGRLETFCDLGLQMYEV